MSEANHKKSRFNGSTAPRAALSAILSSPPAECGPDMPRAPARGPVVVAPQAALVPKGEEGWSADGRGHAGFVPMREADVWDRMAVEAVRAKRPAPFGHGQIAMARRYRDLAERHDAGAVSVSRLDADRGCGSGGGGFADAWLAMGAELAMIRRRIGDGAALSVRRVRPSQRGLRRSIPDRVLVDAVCLGGASLDAVLRRHGWQVDGPLRDRAREALSEALDRMIGYRGVSRGLDA